MSHPTSGKNHNRNRKKSSITVGGKLLYADHNIGTDEASVNDPRDLEAQLGTLIAILQLQLGHNAQAS
jgi:hypothetical protein